MHVLLDFVIIPQEPPPFLKSMTVFTLDIVPENHDDQFSCALLPVAHDRSARKILWYTFSRSLKTGVVPEPAFHSKFTTQITDSSRLEQELKVFV